MEIQGDGGEKTQLQSPPWMKKRRAMAGMTLEVFLSTDGESPEVDMQSPLAVETPRRVTMMMATKKMMEDDEEGMVTERRHKRMMKNRESAARSRARKQAYTSELENKISRLEEENERLRKQREMENMICYMPPLQMKFQLRRTSSSPL